MHDSYKTLQRLESLPLKASRPFVQLLNIEHISEEVITGVLDMVELGGRSEHALAYAISYQHLVKSSVPMKDILAMAKKHGRMINPRWSRTRWMEEHRKLGRISTLIMLASDNFRYDLYTYKSLLPDYFSGYLIPSSRRLGAEGLRQDHCVASYDTGIRNGRYCIAAIFIDKERWTVQLTHANNRLAVTQIKAKYNKPADKATRESINDLLGIKIDAGDDAQISVTQSESDLLRANLTTIVNRLRILGVSTVYFEFDGYGDSGNFEIPSCYRGAECIENCEQLFSGISVNYHSVERQWDGARGQYHSIPTNRELSLWDALVMAAETHVDSTGIDWYNNDGGRGEYTLDVENGTFSLDIDVRYTDTTCEHSEEDVPIEDI